MERGNTYCQGIHIDDDGSTSEVHDISHERRGWVRRVCVSQPTEGVRGVSAVECSRYRTAKEVRMRD